MPADDLWRCGYCGQIYVIPTLARLCEAKHESETADDPQGRQVVRDGAATAAQAAAPSPLG